MKNEIVNNAIELFAQKGYYGCTLEEIANSVSIKKRVYTIISQAKLIFMKHVQIELSNTLIEY
ncbi:TetR family transcriptional regulator [Staphylococcus simulans]|uniref:TetR family transcriptional regulator n=1 Tax=Staphylococcus simulans TaxID=1286 RepID=UPI001F53FDA1|nr:TetR family transcriptional regulator [Staphylococcus simulans]